MDPFSLSLAVTSGVAVVLATSRLFNVTIRRFKGLSTSDEAVIAESRRVTEELTALLSNLPQESRTLEDEAQLQEVFAGLIETRGQVSRAKTRREVRQALDLFRAQQEKLVSILHRGPDARYGSDAEIAESQTQMVPNITFDGTSRDATSQEATDTAPGFSMLSLPSEIEAEVVFIHGIYGQSQETWAGRTASKGGQVFWPKDFLASDMEKVRVWTFDYDSEFHFQEISGFERLTERLLLAVDNLVKVSTAKIIVLVAHSLGGLLVKAALSHGHGRILSSSGGKRFGLIFFGTPRSFTSPAAKSAQFASIISALRAPGTDRRSIDKVSEMSSSGSSILRESEFRNALSSLSAHVPIVSFFEENSLLTTRGDLKLVEDFIGNKYPGEEMYRLSGDHVTLCKFESRDEKAYMMFVDKLKEMIANREGISTFDGKYALEPNEKESKWQVKTSLLSPIPLRSDADEQSSPDRGGSTNAMLSTISSKSNDFEKVNISNEYTAYRPNFEVPLAKWTPSDDNMSNYAQWFIPEFNDWMADSGCKTLLLRGPSGCGKTTVVKSALESFSSSEAPRGKARTTCVVHLFFRSDQTANQDLQDVLKALIAQIVDQNPVLIRHVAAKDVKNSSTLFSFENDLLSILHTLLQDSYWSNILCVIDAVEEWVELYEAISQTSTLEQFNETPISKLLHVLMEIPNLKAIITSSSNVCERPSSPFGNDCPGIRKRLIPTLNSFQKEFAKFLNEIPQRKITRGSDAIHGDNLYDHHLKQLMLGVSSPGQESFAIVKLCLQYFDRVWTDSPTSHHFRFWADLTQRFSDRNFLYYQLVEPSNVKGNKILETLLYLPRLFQPVRPVDLEMIQLLVNSTVEDLDVAQGSLELGLGLLLQGQLGLLITGNNAEVRLCSYEFQGFCLEHIVIKRNGLEFLHPKSSAKGQTQNTSAEVHLRIARACLKLLLLYKTARNKFEAHVESPASTVPLLSYAEKFWSRHASLAGSKAIELNSFIRKHFSYTAKKGKPNDDRTVTSASKLLTYLAREDLSHNIRTIFSEHEPLLREYPNVLDDTFDKVALSSSVSTINELIHLEDKVKDNKRTREMRNRDIILLIRKEDMDGIRKALDGVDLRVKEHFLNYAVQCKKYDLMRHILDRYFDANKHSPERLKTMQVAISLRDQSALNLMATKSALFDLNSSLLIATNAGDGNICEFLLRQKANPNSADSHGRTALHVASLTGQLRLVQVLLKWRARPGLIDNKSRTALHCAAEYGHTDLVDLFLKTSTMKEEKDTSGRTPLFVACAQGYRTTAACLWQSGANLSHKDNEGRSMLHAAANRGSDDVVQLLLRAGVSIDSRDIKKRTPLHEAALKGWAPIVWTLVTAGANIFAEDHRGLTPLHDVCCTSNAPEVVADQLLALGADVNAKTYKRPNEGKESRRYGEVTPLHLAARYSTVRLVKVLLNYGARVSDKDEVGRLPSMYASESLREKAQKMNLLAKSRTASFG